MATIFNHDIAGLVQRLDRFQVELNHSVSGGSSEFNPFDGGRITSYLTAFTVYLDWVVAQPQLDLPESHPRAIDMADETKPAQVENESVNDIARLLSILRDELVNSQSARKPAGVIDFDEKRCRAVVVKIETFLSEFVGVVSPLDLPESSPRIALSPAGKRGT